MTRLFITTTSLSPVAKKAAQWLKIETKERFAINKAYPMIKCNINQSSKEKIYHLPFDQQYDRTKIDPALGEFYATSIAEAESKGFRRALRYFGDAHDIMSCNHASSLTLNSRGTRQKRAAPQFERDGKPHRTDDD